MRETGEVQAFYTLLSFLMVPAVLLLAAGVRYWYAGYQQQLPDKVRWGKMFTMFGIIFTVILLICSFFLTGKLPGG